MCIGAAQAPVALGSASRKGRAACAWCPYVHSASARCSLFMACSPIKIYADDFFSNYFFNVKYILAKNNPILLPLLLQFFVLRARYHYTASIHVALYLYKQ